MIETAVLSDLRYLAPALALVAAAVVALLLHVFLRRRGPRAAGWAALSGVVLALVLLAAGRAAPGPLFAGGIRVDAFALFVQLTVLLATGLAILLAFRFFGAEQCEPGEVYPLFLLAAVGMMTAVTAADLVTLYVSFELFAVTSYVLAGIFKKDPRSSEAGVKYFFLGTLSSGCMLLGMALVFGLSGETSYAAAGRALAGANEHIALAAMILFFAGLFFKAAFIPFHMWAPDIYEGAPTPVAVFLSTASKAAVLGILIRAMTSLFGGLSAHWLAIFQALALATMFWGNIAALLQDNIKRLLAYSSIAHAGYLAIGLAAWSEAARGAVLFYLFVYVFMNAAAFSVVLLARRGQGFNENVADLRGLVRTSPLAAASVLVVLLSLTGIPPTAGFMGKYLLFAAAVEKKLYLLAAAGALNSVISLFYYFRIGRAIFMEEPDAASAAPQATWSVRAVMVVAALVLLLAGLWPSRLLELAGVSTLWP